MPRLFTGLEVPPELALQLSTMRGGIPGARWIDPENYHITLRFIGDISDPDARAIADALDDVRMPPFEIALSGVGYFGARKPRNVWVGVKPVDMITGLHQSHERLCTALGLARDGRNFTPHVTLARLKNSARADVEAYVSHHSLFSVPPFVVDRFVLFSSRPSRGGGPYVAEQVYDLSYNL